MRARLFTVAAWLSLAVGCRLATSDAHADAPPSPSPAASAPQPLALREGAARLLPRSVESPSTPAAHAVPARPPSPPSDTAPALRFAGTDLLDTQLLQQLKDSEPVAFKPVGSTSTVFRMRLRGPVDGAFKAASKERPLGPTAEVAAYRIARCLRLDNVPPAVSRELPLRTLSARIEPESAEKWPEIAPRLIVDAEGMVHGAVMYWLKDLSDLDFGPGSARTTALGWLRGDGALPEARRPLAASLSNMFAFDYLIANADRWSGGNVMGDAHGTRVYIRDHDLAFSQQNPAQHRKQWQLVSRVERFSRAFYAHLQALSRGCMERELLQDPRGASGELLSERQVRALLDRKQALVSHIQALIAERGEQAVLAFE